MSPQRTNGLAWPDPQCVQTSTVILLSRTTHEGHSSQRCQTNPPSPKGSDLKYSFILAYASRCPQASLSPTPRDGGSQGVLSQQRQKYKDSEQKHSKPPRASDRDGASITPGRSRGPDKAHGQASRGQTTVTRPRAWG